MFCIGCVVGVFYLFIFGLKMQEILQFCFEYYAFACFVFCLLFAEGFVGLFWLVLSIC